MANNEAFRKQVERWAKELGASYTEVELILNGLVDEALLTEMSVAKKSAVLLAIETQLSLLQQTTSEFILRVTPQAYKLGLNEFKKLGIDKALSPAHANIVNELINEAQVTFGAGLDGIRKQANTVLSRAVQGQIQIDIGVGIAEGQSVKKIADAVIDGFGKNGFTSFITKNGRSMPLGWYSEMLVRTTASAATNTAVLARGGELGITIYQVSSHPGGTDDEACAAIDGKLFDTTGKKYPIPPNLPSATHPNCRHVLLPRPDLP